MAPGHLDIGWRFVRGRFAGVHALGVCDDGARLAARLDARDEELRPATDDATSEPDGDDPDGDGPVVVRAFWHPRGALLPGGRAERGLVQIHIERQAASWSQLVEAVAATADEHRRSRLRLPR